MTSVRPNVKCDLPDKSHQSNDRNFSKSRFFVKLTSIHQFEKGSRPQKASINNAIQETHLFFFVFVIYIQIILLVCEK